MAGKRFIVDTVAANASSAYFDLGNGKATLNGYVSGHPRGEKPVGARRVDSIDETSHLAPVLEASRIPIHRVSDRKAFQFSSGSPLWLTR